MNYASRGNEVASNVRLPDCGIKSFRQLKGLLFGKDTKRLNNS